MDEARPITSTSSWLGTRAKGDRAAWVVWVAWGSCALYWAAVSTGFMLRLSHHVLFQVGDEVGVRLNFGAFATVGAIIAARRPHNRLGWILCAISLTWSVAFLAQDYAIFALLRRREWLPGAVAMGWLGSWPWYIATGLLVMYVPLLFPDGRLPSPRWRPVAWAAAICTTVTVLWAAFAPRPLESSPGIAMPWNPLAIEEAAGVFRLLFFVPTIVIPGLTFLSLSSLVMRLRRAHGVERQQLKWVTYAAVLSLGVWELIVLLRLDGRVTESVSVWQDVVLTIDIFLMPVAIGVAILRYHLYDIDRLINRTVVYGLLTVLLGAAYDILVTVLGQLFGGLGGEPPSWVIAAATLVVAALFQPVRRRIQGIVDRRFNRRRYDAARTIEAFGSRLRGRIDLDTITVELVAVVHRALEPTSAGLWLADRGRVAGKHPGIAEDPSSPANPG